MSLMPALPAAEEQSGRCGLPRLGGRQEAELWGNVADFGVSVVVVGVKIQPAMLQCGQWVKEGV